MKYLRWQDASREEEVKFASTINIGVELILHLNFSIHHGVRNFSCFWGIKHTLIVGNKKY